MRVSSYAVVVRAGEVLLTRWVSPVGPQWSLPGGGIEHGEDVRDAALREVAEETGYVAELDRLLTVDSLHLPRVPIHGGGYRDHFGIRVIYAAHIVGGQLRHEIGGSSDQAAWFPLQAVDSLVRVTLVDIGLAAWRAEDPGRHAVLRPADLS